MFSKLNLQEDLEVVEIGDSPAKKARHNPQDADVKIELGDNTTPLQILGYIPLPGDGALPGPPVNFCGSHETPEKHLNKAKVPFPRKEKLTKPAADIEETQVQNGPETPGRREDDTILEEMPNLTHEEEPTQGDRACPATQQEEYREDDEQPTLELEEFANVESKWDNDWEGSMLGNEMDEMHQMLVHSMLDKSPGALSETDFKDLLSTQDDLVERALSQLCTAENGGLKARSDNETKLSCGNLALDEAAQNDFKFPMNGCAMCTKFQRAMQTDEKLKQGYKACKTRLKKEAFRQTYAKAEFELAKKERTYEEGMRQEDIDEGEYLPFVRLVEKEGGFQFASSIKAAKLYALKCIKMGHPWVSPSPMTERLEFLRMSRKVRHIFTRSRVS